MAPRIPGAAQSDRIGEIDPLPKYFRTPNADRISKTVARSLQANQLAFDLSKLLQIGRNSSGTKIKFVAGRTGLDFQRKTNRKMVETFQGQLLLNFQLNLNKNFFVFF